MWLSRCCYNNTSLLLLASNFVDKAKSNIIKTPAINLSNFALVNSKAKIHTLHSMLVYSALSEITMPCTYAPLYHGIPSYKDLQSQNLYLDHT